MAVSRRVLLFGTASMMAQSQNTRPAVEAVDHLLLGVNDLDRGVAWVEQRTGLRAAIGGVHSGMGTRNALLPLGARHYLEILAPDPAQTAYNFQMDVRSLAEPRLITWAAATADIDGVAKAAGSGGYSLLGPRAGERRTPAGKVLQWRSLGVMHKLGGADGIDPVPFFIQWAAGSSHPSQDPPAGCQLQALHCTHPDPPALTKLLRSLGIAPEVTRGETARLRAVVQTPKGLLELS